MNIYIQYMGRTGRGGFKERRGTGTGVEGWQSITVNIETNDRRAGCRPLSNSSKRMEEAIEEIKDKTV